MKTSNQRHVKTCTHHLPTAYHLKSISQSSQHSSGIRQNKVGLLKEKNTTPLTHTESVLYTYRLFGSTPLTFSGPYSNGVVIGTSQNATNIHVHRYAWMDGQAILGAVSVNFFLTYIYFLQALHCQVRYHRDKKLIIIGQLPRYVAM